MRCLRRCLPYDVFDAVPGRPPLIARPDACQTCFMCELYCTVDALYVGPNADVREPVSAEAVVKSGLLGQYPTRLGLDEWADRYPNEQWRMETVFRRAAQAASSPA